MKEDFSSVMTKLAALCNATDATLLMEAKLPPKNAIITGKEKSFIRYMICNKNGEVLLHEETQADAYAACKLILYAYEDYIIHNGMEMHITDL